MYIGNWNIYVDVDHNLFLAFQFRMLLLDNQVQLSESDGIYTSSLMSDEDYSGADILILGNNYKKKSFFLRKFPFIRRW